VDPDSMGPEIQIRTGTGKRERSPKKKKSKKPMWKDLWRAEGFTCSITVLFMSLRKNLWKSFSIFTKFFFQFFFIQIPDRSGSGWSWASGPEFETMIWVVSPEAFSEIWGNLKNQARIYNYLSKLETIQKIVNHQRTFKKYCLDFFDLQKCIMYPKVRGMKG
jgi:hypothetical protein